MPMKCFLNILFFLFIFINSVSAQPVSWNFSYKKKDKTLGELIFSANIEKGWHIYSIHQTGDGPIATSILFDENKSISFINGLVESTPEKKFSEVFGIEVSSFSSHAEFRQELKINSKSNTVIKGILEFMACNEVSCLPPKTINFEVQIKAD